MKKIILASVIFFLSINFVHSQVTQEWVARYNGTAFDYDVAVKLKVDKSGNVYVTGRSTEPGTGEDIVTVKYNSSGVQQWVRSYNGGPGLTYDSPSSMALDDSGNVYVTGEIARYNSVDSEDIFTVKYSPAGVQQWVAIYNGPDNGSDVGLDIKVDHFSNVYVTGGSADSRRFYHCTTIKYNSSGIQQWIQKYDTATVGTSISIDGSGDIYVAGVDGHPVRNYLIIKYNASGVQQWVRTNSGLLGDNDSPTQISDALGNVYVTGRSHVGGFTNIFTFSYNSSGTLRWQESYAGPAGLNAAPTGIVQDVGGNIYVSGSSDRTSAITDCTTLKYNSSGVQQWVRRYIAPSNLNSYGSCLSLDTSGNVYVSGSIQQAGQQMNFRDYLTLKYTPGGTQEWIETYNGPGNADDEVVSNAVDASYNVYVTGFSFGFGTLFDYATIKYSQRIFIIGIPFIRGKIDLLKANVDTLVISQILPPNFGAMLNNNLQKASDHLGQGHNHQSLFRMNLFKFEVNLLIGLHILPPQYGQPLIIAANEIINLIKELNEHHNEDIPVVENKSFSLTQNYPNPFNPSTRIRYEIPFNSFVTLKVYDLLGRQVATLVSEDLSAGSHEVEWNASNYASGIYFYKLTAEIDGNKFERTMKMILVK